MWSLIENEDGTKTVTYNDHVVGIYAESNGRWTAITLTGQMFWGDSELEVYNQLVGIQ
jgi:hypothetical protein